MRPINAVPQRLVELNVTQTLSSGPPSVPATPGTERAAFSTCSTQPARVIPSMSNAASVMASDDTPQVGEVPNCAVGFG